MAQETQLGGVFDGTSDQGDFQSALAGAIETAMGQLTTDSVSWTLVSVHGQYGGFADDRRLTVRIHARGPSQAAQDVGPAMGARNPTGGEQGHDVEVPTFLSGIVARAGMDICMDGADYLLYHAAGATRLKPNNDEVREYLENVAGTRQRVAVAGYPGWGTMCPYLRTYYAGPFEEIIERLGVRFT
jgi:hypothetical protein